LAKKEKKVYDLKKNLTGKKYEMDSKIENVVLLIIDSQAYRT